MPTMICEIDVLLQDQVGSIHHMGTFKFEIDSGLLGTSVYTRGRSQYNQSSQSMGYGYLKYDVSLRPKNNDINERNE